MESSSLGTRAASELGLDPNLRFVAQSEAFARMLANYVPLGGRDQRVMLEKTCRLMDRFVTFRHRGEFLLCEASSNTFLPRERQLSAEEEQRLHELGWHPPDSDFPRRSDDAGCPNWHLTVTVASAGVAAILLIRTLHEICGAESLADVFVHDSCIYFEYKDLCGRYLHAASKEWCECDPAEVHRQYWRTS